MAEHNSPEDRGSADAYYGRRRDPHKYLHNTRVTLSDKDEIAEYMRGYENEEDRKDWK